MKALLQQTLAATQTPDILAELGFSAESLSTPKFIEVMEIGAEKEKQRQEERDKLLFHRHDRDSRIAELNKVYQQVQKQKEVLEYFDDKDYLDNVPDTVDTVLNRDWSVLWDTAKSPTEILKTITEAFDTVDFLTLVDTVRSIANRTLETITQDLDLWKDRGDKVSENPALQKKLQELFIPLYGIEPYEQLVNRLLLVMGAKDIKRVERKLEGTVLEGTIIPTLRPINVEWRMSYEEEDRLVCWGGFSTNIYNVCEHSSEYSNTKKYRVKLSDNEIQALFETVESFIDELEDKILPALKQLHLFEEEFVERYTALGLDLKSSCSFTHNHWVILNNMRDILQCPLDYMYHWINTGSKLTYAVTSMLVQVSKPNDD